MQRQLRWNAASMFVQTTENVQIHCDDVRQSAEELLLPKFRIDAQTSSMSCVLSIKQSYKHATFISQRSKFRSTTPPHLLSGADSIGHGDTCPHFYKRLNMGAAWVEEQITRNWPNCTDHHKSAHHNDWLYFESQKSGGARHVRPIFNVVPLPPPTMIIVISRGCMAENVRCDAC